MITMDTSTPQLKLVKKWIDAYLSLDLREMDKVLAKGYKHEALPKTIGLPEETKEEYMKRYGELLPVFTKYNPTIHEVIEIPGKVVLHATDICSTVHGITLTAESIFTVSFVEEDGELKVSRCKEFIDTQEHNTWGAKIVEAAAKEAPAS